ncbi:hypothetical protein ES703_94959 [subsurface metagenome]
MKTLNPAPKFLIYAVIRALRHPKTPIIYLYCPDCRLRFNPNASECPKCHKKVGHSPENRQESPLPWWGAVLCIIIGIGTWVTSACLEIPGLDEAARALVYIPLGSLFGMSLKRD